MAVPRKKPKNPPVMSHEFVIQNHADIVSCIAIVIILGLVFELTAKFSRVFIFIQYAIKNETQDTEDSDEVPQALSEFFGRGPLDIFTVLFQSLIVIVVHAVIQEYCIDKISRRLHLSKTKTSRFNESGQLFVWSLASTIWAAHRIYENGYFVKYPLLWEGYPHTQLFWQDKLFLLAQMAYWVHMYPELYLQKVRKDEARGRLQYFSLYLTFIAAAYTFHFWRVLIVILAFHYFVETLFHAARMLYFAEMDENAQWAFKIWAICYPLARLVILSTTMLVFWYGLKKVEQEPDFPNGNFNTASIRLVCLSGVGFIQLWLMWGFIRLQLRRRRESQPAAPKKKAPTKGKGKKKKVDSDNEEFANGKLKQN